MLYILFSTVFLVYILTWNEAAASAIKATNNDTNLISLSNSSDEFEADFNVEVDSAVTEAGQDIKNWNVKTHYRNEESLRVLLNSSNYYNTLNDLVEDMEAWQAPADMQKDFPCYLAGYDYEDRPIWVVEIGLWDIRTIVETGGERLKTFDKYIQQVMYRGIMSLENKALEEDGDNQRGVLILDFNHATIRQAFGVPTLNYALNLVKDIAPLAHKHLGAAFLVNVNYAAERLVSLIRPLLGSAFERIEVFGANRSKWIPHLLRTIPRDQLPEWYGGISDFKPLVVYG